jgi:TP901 family phage tail tape measure protein
MSDVNAQIRVSIETQQAQAQLQALQQQITLLQKSMAANAGKNMDLGVGQASAQLGQLQGKVMSVRDAVGTLDRQIAASSRGFAASFKTFTNAARGTGTEMELIKRRAGALAAEYKKIGDGANGMATVLKTSGSAGQQAMAESAMRMQMMTRSLDQMGTAALNWGKNMQWAGRQLMVGFTVPLTIFAAVAVKAFQDVEREIVNLQRVYGDFTTSSAETDRMTQSIKELSVEMANLGFTAKETISIAADAAATGAVGQDLIDMTKNATQLAALGMISQEQALDTIISMNSAFGVAADELGGVVDYLNAVENQTVLSLGDMTEAIPLVAPVVKGLGGDVKELAVVMTAMREGGIGANEAANALKTGLARLITPTKQAKETAAQFGINLTKIVAENEGDFLGMIDAMAAGLSNLSDLQQQQVLSDVFGKRQFARFGALFENFNKEGSQAARTMDLLGASAEDLARQTDKELSALEESDTMKLAKAMEELKMAIAPIGQMVIQFIQPLVSFGAKIADMFNNLPEIIKNGIGMIAGGIALVVPAVLMLTGLIGNLVGNFLNGVKSLANLFFGFKGAAAGAQSLTTEQLEQQAAATALASAQNQVTNAIEMQERAVYDLAQAYNRLNAQQASAGGALRPPMRFATGGRVPGSGNTDKIPALLTPGEFVINKNQSQKHSGFLSALNAGTVQGFARGGIAGGSSDLTHTRSGGKLFVSTNDPEGDAKLKERLRLRREELEIVKQTADTETAAGRAAVAAAEDELRVLGDIETRWESIKAEASESGFVGHMELNSNAVASLDKGFNNAIKSTGKGASGQFTAQALNANPDAYSNVVYQELQAMGDATQEQAEDLTNAGRRLTAKMEAIAEGLPDDVVVVDDIENNRAEAGKQVIALEELERQAQEDIVRELEAELAAMEADDSIDQSIKDAKKRELEAQQRLADRLEKAERQVAEARTGLQYDPDASPEQLKARKKKMARQGVPGKKDKYIDAQGQTHYPSQNEAAATKRGRLKKAGGGYGAIEAESQQMLQDLQEMGNLIDAKAEEIGRGIPEAVARGIKSSNVDETAARQAGAEAVDAYGEGAEVSSPSRATDRVGQELNNGLTQGINKNKSAPIKAARAVGEQMELEFDEGFEGERVGAEQMDEAQRGVNSKPVTTAGGSSQKNQFMRGKAGMAGMFGGQAVSLLGMAAMAQEGEKVAGVSKELVGSFTMVAGQLNSFAGMLPPMAQGIVAAGTLLAAGVTYGVAKWREGVDEASREAAELGASLGGAADAAKRMADMFGQATLLEKKRQLTVAEDDKEKYAQFTPMFESDEGMKIIEEMKSVTSSQRYEAMGDYVKNAIVQGFVEGADAELFAKAFAEQTGELGLAESLSQEIAAFNATYESTTDKAIALAQERMKAIEEDPTLQAAKSNMADGKQLSYTDASAVLGSSMAGIQDWSTVLEAAKNDYNEGRISFQKLKETTDQVAQAQRDLSTALQYALENNTDGGGVEQALKSRLMAQGYDEDTAGGVKDRLKKEMSKNFSRDQQDLVEKGQAEARARAEKDLAGMEEGFDKDMMLEDYTNRYMDDFYQDLADASRKNAKAFDKKLEESLGMVASAVANGMSLEQAEDLAAQISDSSTVTSQAYTDAMLAGRTEFEAMQAAIAAWNIEKDPTSPLADDKDLRSQYVGQVGISQDPTSMGGIVAGMDAEQIKRTLDAFSKFTGESFGTGDKRLETSENRVNLEQVLGSSTGILGPELTAMLAPHVATGIENGMEDGGISGIGKLSDLLGGDREALKAYVEVILADGSIGEDELAKIITNLEYANERIPTELQIAIGLDLKDPKGKNVDPMEWQALIDDTALMANMIEGIDTEEEKALAIQFAFQDGVKRKNLTPANFRKEFQQVMDLIDEMDGADFETRKKIMVDIITEMNGKQADPNQVENAIDDLQYKFGNAGVNNIPPTIYSKVIDMKVDASGMLERAREMMRLAQAAGSEAGIAEAQELMDAAKALDDSANDLAAENVWGGSGDSGGGGGGGGDKEFDDGQKDTYDPKARWDKYRKREESKQIGIIGYTEAMRRSTNLTDDAIEALKEDEEAFKEWRDAYAKGQKAVDAWEKKYMKGKGGIGQSNANTTRQVVTDAKRDYRAQAKMNKDGLGYFEQQQLLNDPELMSQYMSKDKKLSKDAANQARERAMAETTVLDVLEREIEVRNQLLDYQQQQMELSIMQAEYAAEDAFFAGTGTDRAELDQRNDEIAADMEVINKKQIAPIKHQIQLEQDKIKIKQRGMKIYEDEIKKLNKEVQARQRIIEDMKRSLELRQREGEMLDHDLQLMGYQEEDINEMYDKRIASLEKVLSINEAISAQQSSQLNLASALTSGDIGAAAKAAQEMQALQAQQASDAYMSQMETNRDNAINSLTGAESGMTREQIEDRKRVLDEDSYQTNLKIRNLEDEIYNYNRLIRDEQDQINLIKDDIETHNAKIKDYEWDIFQIESKQLRTLQDQQIKNDALLAQADQAVTYAAAEEKIQLARFERGRKLEEATQQLQLAGLEILEQQGELHRANFLMLSASAKAAKEYWNAMTKGTLNENNLKMPDIPMGKSKKFKKKYNRELARIGKMFENIDMTALDVNEMIKSPRYNIAGATTAVPQSAVNGIMGSVTNNYMNNSVNVNAASANANEVADIVIQRLALEKLKNVGGPK